MVCAAKRTLDGEDGWVTIDGEGKGITHYKPGIPAEGHLTRRLFGAMLRRGPEGTPVLPVSAG